MDILIIITGVVLLLYAVCILYYRWGWKQLPVDNQPKHPPSTAVTVLIAARNEAENLPALLTSLQQQRYPLTLMEVIVIDDHSTDETASIASSFPFVKVISLADFITEPVMAYKKKALETGIDQSLGELLITTDADCIVPPNWLENIVAFYEEHKKEMIVMPVVYTSPRTALDIFQTLDFLSLQGITGAAVQLGLHPMSNGANLAFTRKAYYAVEGYKGIQHKASGDDILLMQKMEQAFPNGIGYLKSKDVIVETKPMPDIVSFFRQRIRWASKSSVYQKDSMLLVMLLVYVLNVLLVVIPIASIWSSDAMFYLLIWLILLLIKSIIEYTILIPVATFFKRMKWLIYFPFAQPFHIVYTVVSGALGFWGGYTWKDRKVK